MSLDNDPQPRTILDTSFNDLLAEVRDMTRALYPEARIPETPMTTEDPAAAKLDHLAEILDATNLAAEAKYEIIRIAMEYGSLRAQKAEPPRRNAIYGTNEQAE